MQPSPGGRSKTPPKQWRPTGPVPKRKSISGGLHGQRDAQKVRQAQQGSRQAHAHGRRGVSPSPSLTLSAFNLSPLTSLPAPLPSAPGPCGEGALYGALDALNVALGNCDFVEERHEALPQAGAPRRDVAQLTVSLIGARELRALDLGGKSDPYCTCKIQGHTETEIKTRVMLNTLEPAWNHTEALRGCAEGDTVEFVVYDWDVSKENDFMGRAILDFEEFFPEGFEGDLPLSDVSGRRATGTLTVKVEVSAPDDASVSVEGSSEFRPPDRLQDPSDPQQADEIMSVLSTARTREIVDPDPQDAFHVPLSQEWSPEMAFQRLPRSGEAAFKKKSRQHHSVAKVQHALSETLVGLQKSLEVGSASAEQEYSGTGDGSQSLAHLEASLAMTPEGDAAVELSAGEEELPSTLLLLSYLKEVALAHRSTLFTEDAAISEEHQYVRCFLDEVAAVKAEGRRR